MSGSKLLVACIGASLVLSSPALAQAVRPMATADAGNAQLQSGMSRGLVTIDLQNVTVEAALLNVADQAGLRLLARKDLLSSNKLVTVRLSAVPAADAVKQILKGTRLSATISPTGRLLVEEVKNGRTVAQGVIAGKVTDAKNGKGISGASVSVADARGVTTGEDGSYRLSGVSSGVQTVTVRLVGYAKQSRSVTVGEGATVTADFKLDQSANVLDQVIVTGTVVQTELKAVPNAITVITAKQLEERGITKIDQLFRGDVPGLFAQNQGTGALLDEVTMFSRGATALSSASAGISAPSGFIAYTNPIKTYVDGVELADSKYLSQIDPKSIERIEILSGPQASTIYGSNAINGVMQIFTKRGSTSRPQLNLSLLSGWVENDFTSAHTPQHDYSAQMNGIEGKLSYNAGGSWLYVGPWAPAKQTSRIGGFGGARFELPTKAGQVFADVTLRRTATQNLQRGAQNQVRTGYQETGWWLIANASGVSQPTTQTLSGQTFGFVLGHAITNWWSHEFGMGQDVSEREQAYTSRGYRTPSDTTLSLQQNRVNRRSLRYTTTTRLPVASFALATVTAGADAWQNVTSAWSVLPQSLTGTLTSSSSFTSVSRVPSHNTGGFFQTQLGIWDRLFLTYGIRAEWNPDYGDEVQPNMAPRYGMAYSQELGGLTAKLRGSYGRSTRPPQRRLKNAVPAAERYGDSWIFFEPAYGKFDYYLNNPDLGPEHQQGGEGGVELYFGTRGSLVVTRYNQTVDGLIDAPLVDSVDVLPEARAMSGALPWQYPTYQYQYLNVGTIRNQGWESQGSLNLGPFTTRGTYSWTKSRVAGITPRYRSFFTPTSYPQYQAGASFQFLPEHTWAFGITYAKAATTVGLNMNGAGRVTNIVDDFSQQYLDANIRLMQNRQSVTITRYTNASNRYSMADLTASHRFMSRAEGVLLIQNLTDKYKNDFYALFPTMGRQVKAGARLRL